MEHLPSNRPLPERFRFAEAYKLMKYQSETTGDVLWIWNSRDGITPFGTIVQKDGKKDMLQHTDWHEDVFVPNFIPPIGMRVFIDVPDFDVKKHQFNVKTAIVDQKMHDAFYMLAKDHPWVPRKVSSFLKPTRFT